MGFFDKIACQQSQVIPSLKKQQNICCECRQSQRGCAWQWVGTDWQIAHSCWSAPDK